MFTKSWYSVLPRFIDEYDVVLYDYPGQGNSTSKDEEYYINRFCDYLTIILDTLSIDKIHIMGISYGGFIAMDYARLHKSRLHTVTVSGALLSNEALYNVNVENTRLLIEKAPFDLFCKLLYERIFGENFFRNVKPFLQSMQKKLYDRYVNRKYSIIRLVETQRTFFEELENNMDGYRTVDIPVLVMCGDEDILIPHWIQRKICDVFPNSRFELIKNSGHVVYLEQPDIFFGNMKKLVKAKSVEF
jgi:pimeloyl-ACP methyl ester carboxylesterase